MQWEIRTQYSHRMRRNLLTDTSTCPVSGTIRTPWLFGGFITKFIKAAWNRIKHCTASCNNISTMGSTRQATVKSSKVETCLICNFYAAGKSSKRVVPTVKISRLQKQFWMVFVPFMTYNEASVYQCYIWLRVISLSKATLELLLC